jgi:glutamyl/glutaminyl-tRNA synthetase
MPPSPRHHPLAPSPTGQFPHRRARTALFCWAFAKKHHGHFLLRIEDTDAARSSDESAKGIMEDLAWLGIEWDEGPELQVSGKTIGGDPRGVGPFFQARRLKTHYDPHIMRLVEQGKAYPAIDTEEELAAEKKKAADAKANYRYNRASLAKIPDIKDRIKLIESGEPHVIRFFSPHEEINFTDGPGRREDAPGEVDDFIIRRARRLPMAQLRRRRGRPRHGHHARDAPRSTSPTPHARSPSTAPSATPRPPSGTCPSSSTWTARR